MDRAAKTSSLRVKYLRFLFDTNSAETPRWPAFKQPDGVPLLQLLEYIVWMLSPRGNIGTLASAANYVAALAIWSQEKGYPTDIRGGLVDPTRQATYDLFRARYKSDMPVLKIVAPKLPLECGHIEAIALDCNLAVREDLRDLALILTAFCSGIRIGHFAPKRIGMQRHVLMWGSLLLKDDLYGLWLHSTKTRPSGAHDGTWTAVGARPTALPCLDPVRVMHAWKAMAYGGDDLLPVFAASHDSTLPLSRHAFTAMLRRRLQRALVRLPRHNWSQDLSRFSGISLRHGFGTALWGRIAAHRLSEAMDHAPPPGMASTAHYGRDNTLAARAANTGEIPFAA